MSNRDSALLFTISSIIKEMLHRNTLQGNIKITFLWVKMSLSLVDRLPPFRWNLLPPSSGKGLDCSFTPKTKAAGLFNNVKDSQDCTTANRADLYSGNAVDVYLSDTQLESRPGRWLS